MKRTRIAGVTGALLLLGIALLLVKGCGDRSPGDAASSSPSASGVVGQVLLNRGVGPEPESLDPHKSRTVQASTVQRDLFEGLIVYSADGEMEGGVAERWEVSADGLEYRFWLRPEARWSNGEAVTADDFVFSFRRLVDPDTAAFFANVLSPVVNADAINAGDMSPDELAVEAVGAGELVIRLRQPTPYFLQLLAQPSTMPVNASSIEQHGDAFARPGNLVSNGAYVLDSWSLGSVIEVHRNPEYRDDANTCIDRVRYHVAEQPSTELYRYRAGELDITSTIPTDSFEQLKEQMPDQMRIAPTLGTYFYGLNLNKPKLGDSPALREALSLAIDREVLAHEVVGRGELPAYTFVPPGINNYESPRPAVADMSDDERIRRAKRAYTEAGYGPDNPLEVELRYNTSDTHRRIALAVQQMWKDVLGFEVTLINEEFRVLVVNIEAMEITEMFRLTWSGDYNDANSFLYLFRTDDPSNMFGYSNEELDSLLEQAASQTNLERRRWYLEEAERVLLSDPPVIPLYFHVSKHLVSPRVKGWQDNVLDYHYSRHLCLEPDR